MMITSFPTPAGPNIGGNARILFIPYNDIATLPQISNARVTSPVETLSGLGFRNLPCVLDRIPFTEQGGNDDNGVPVSWLTGGFYAGSDDDIAYRMQLMETCRHLVLVHDQTNRLRLAGINAPLTFTATFSSGDAPGQARGWSFQFAGSSPLRAPFYLV